MFAYCELDIFLATLKIRYMLALLAFDMLPSATSDRHVPPLAPQGISSCEATYRAEGYIECHEVAHIDVETIVCKGKQ